MMLKKLIFTCLILVSGFGLKAQEIKDSSLFIVAIRPSYAAQLPGGDLGKRFGWSSSPGIGIDVKLRNNFIFGANGTFFFGNKVKEDILAPLRNVDGQIIDQNGVYAKVLTYERGFSFGVNAGYLWHVMSPNPNSGFMFSLGFGYIQHKIRIEHNHNNVPELKGDYLKGYDRLTAGAYVSEFIGYQLLSNSRLVNFFAGFEFYQAFTRSLRDWNIDQVRKDDSHRVDLLSGFRVGWILPLYKRAPKDFYMY